MHVRRSVLRLAGALLLSNSADQFTQVSRLGYVLTRIGSAALVGVVVLCAGLPAVLTAPLAGRLLDRGRPAALIAGGNGAPRRAERGRQRRPRRPARRRTGAGRARPAHRAGAAGAGTGRRGARAADLL